MYNLADILTMFLLGFIAGAIYAGITPSFIRSYKIHRQQKKLDKLTKRALSKAIEKVFSEDNACIVDINGNKSIERI